jgi:hypothetical protein
LVPQDSRRRSYAPGAGRRWRSVAEPPATVGVQHKACGHRHRIRGAITHRQGL